jgi:eukaryotic-like serine/threonine-protein kinase
MMKIVIVEGPDKGAKFEIDSNVTLGRDVTNDIVISDTSISLVHCEITVRDNAFFVKDLGSTNGIKINGVRQVAAELHDGDALKMGKTYIRVEILVDNQIQPTVMEHGSMQTVVGTVNMRQQPDAAGQVEEGSDLSGNIFGSVTYFLKRKIASGGMGSIYEAEQLGAEGFIKKVAIKTILPSYAKKDSFVSSFIGEARLVANLVHQNIVQIHHLGRHGDGYYIAMEYIDGINLTDFVIAHKRQKKQVPLDIATFIISRICRGLEYAHEKKNENGNLLNLVHRDVSPNNIMITREGEVKLTDFGVAKAAQFMEDDAEYLVGSVEYMAPEQAECAKVDSRSDIFGLGVVYYELLTGVRIFKCNNEDDLDATLEVVKKAEVPDPIQFRRDLPENVKRILMTCLKKNPKDRFQTAGELGVELEKQIYSKGYGPTIVTLSKYLHEMGILKKSHV